MKELQTNFTTPEQSKRLLEMGVPEDSADQVYYEDIMWGAHEFLSPEHPYSETVKGHENIATPCWSVGRLIELIRFCTEGIDIYLYDSERPNMVMCLVKCIEKNISDFNFSKLEE